MHQPFFLKAFRGFTLLDALLVFSVAAIITAITLTALSNVNSDRALDIEAGKVLSLLSAARAHTLSAKDSLSFGVHFEERKAVLFSGASYSAEALSNEIQPLHDAVTISSVALSGGGAEVKFKKLTGATDQNGTITLALVKNASKTRVITVVATGLAYSN